MRGKLRTSVWLVAVLILSSQGVSAAGRRKPKAPAVVLTEKGKALEAEYKKDLEALRKKIQAELPKVKDSQVEAYKKALAAEEAAKKELADANKAMAAIGKARGLVGHAKNYWIPKAQKALNAAKQQLAKAKTEDERKEAEAAVESAEKGLQDGKDALKERQAKLDEVKEDESRLKKEQEAASAALRDAQKNALEALDKIGLEKVLASDTLDAMLVEFAVRNHGTPFGFAAFAQQGDEQKTLLDELLKNPPLMRAMLVADGARGGKYGEAMQIFTAILGENEMAKDGVLRRLALAIALEHAVPHGYRHSKVEAEKGAPGTVDPLKRYKHYEAAYLAGELDASFKDHSVWELRMVVDGEEPEEIAAWGREMLRTYRPDQVTTKDMRWRYVTAVRTDIRYGSQDNKYDKDELQFFQNILMNGGVCGRRAFYGRFILRAFGIPTTARPSPGHAALTHWTPKGWVICLGPGWGKGTTKGLYTKDLDFLATTQAREMPEDFLMVKRAQWIGDVMGEKPVYGLHDKADPGFWYGISLYTQRAIIEESKAEALEAVGEELGEANESEDMAKVEKVTVTKDDIKISVTPEGKIVIPAVASSKPNNSTRKIKFMPSFGEGNGMQLHYERTGKDEPFEYTIDAPSAGMYNLTATVATPSWQQHLFLAVNGEGKIDLALPHTVGLWETTEPVQIKLAKGKNTLTFTRGHEGLKGVTIKRFELTPVK